MRLRPGSQGHHVESHKGEKPKGDGEDEEFGSGEGEATENGTIKCFV